MVVRTGGSEERVEGVNVRGGGGGGLLDRPGGGRDVEDHGPCMGSRDIANGCLLGRSEDGQPEGVVCGADD